MNLKRWLVMLTTDPNSSVGLLIRAEIIEEGAEKEDGEEEREKSLLYARILRELAKKDWTIAENKKFIKENLRNGVSV